MFGDTWVIIGLFLLFCELFTGTFYLLILGSACSVTGGIAYNFDTSNEINLALVSILSVLGVFLVNFYRKNSQSYQNFMQQTDDLDIGAMVIVSSFDTSIMQVMYRGVLWQAQFKNAIPPTNNLVGQQLKIVSKQGNLLIVDRIE